MSEISHLQQPVLGLSQSCRWKILWVPLRVELCGGACGYEQQQGILGGSLDVGLLPACGLGKRWMHGASLTGAARRCIHVRSTRKPENEVSRTQHQEIPDLGSSPQRILHLWKCTALMGIEISAAFLYSGVAFECCWDWRPRTVLLTDVGWIDLVLPHLMFLRSQISIT